MEIRNAKKTDLKYIAEIYDQAYDEVASNPNFGDYLRLKRPGAKRIKEWAKNLYSEIRRGNVLFFVAEQDNAVVGFCFVKKKDIPDSEISHVGILGIRITKEFRGRGLGEKLVKRALTESSGRFDTIEVGIMSINRASKSLFKKFGFRRWGVAPGYVKRGKIYMDMEYRYLKL